MSRTQIAKGLALRLHLKPAPRTHSESSAIWKALQDLGPVTSFHVARHPRDATLPASESSSNGSIANVVFAQSTEALDRLKGNKEAQVFTVTANESQKIIKDPYNIRGHRHRKPQLKPQEIQCSVIASVEPDNPQDPISQDIETTQYRNTFRVDRDSIFGEILARTDCPSGLIHGLLPRLRDEHILQTSEMKLAVTQKAFAKEEVFRGAQGQRAGRKTQLVKLDLEQLRVTGGDAVKGQSYVPYDEFATLRGVSLVEMYREATRLDACDVENPAEPQSVAFKPFLHSDGTGLSDSQVAQPPNTRHQIKR